jgi:type VI secretion system secreted protein Hcp
MNTTLLLTGIVMGAILLGSTLHDDAFAAAFLKIADIKGESSDKNHEDEINVLSWSWGMTQSGTTTSTGGGGGAGKVSVQDLSFTKIVDKSTPKLYEKLASGKIIPEIELLISDKKYSGNESYLTFILTNVLVSSVSIADSGGKDRPTESFSLNFEDIKVIYQPFDNKKKSGDSIEFTLNPDRIE